MTPTPRRRAGPLLILAGLATACAQSSSRPPASNRDAGGDFRLPADGAAATGGSTGSGGLGGNVGTGGAAGGSVDAAASDAAEGNDAAGSVSDAAVETGAFCAVSVLPVSVPSLAQVELPPKTPLRVRGTVSRAGAQAPQWTWAVRHNGAPIVTTAVGGDNAVVEFPIVAPGDYVIEASADVGFPCRPALAVATVLAPQATSLTVRITPPSALGLPVQESRIVLSGGTFTPNTLELQGGTNLALRTYASGARLSPAYVRITSASSRITVDGHTRTPFSAVLLSPVTYDILVIPDEPLAPVLVSGVPPLLNGAIALDQSIPVTGRLLDAEGAPVPDAHVVLRAGARPSTIGRSGADGTFTLFTRTGTMSVDVSAPTSSGLPNMSVAAHPGIAVLGEDSALDLTVQWALPATAPLTITVAAPDGATAIAGAMLRLESAEGAATAAVGTLTARTTGPGGLGETALPAAGMVRIDRSTNAGGSAVFPALPAGRYRVTISPPPVSPGAAIPPSLAVTSATFDLPPTGLTHTVSLAQKVKVTGTLSPPAATDGVRLTAIDEESRMATTTVVANGGHYELALDPQRRYALWAQPTRTQPLGRGVVATLTTSTEDGVVRDSIVPPGLSYEGTVTTRGDRIGGALLQVFCAGTATTCPSPELPLAETVTAADGTFRLTLPAPRD